MTVGDFPRSSHSFLRFSNTVVFQYLRLSSAHQSARETIASPDGAAYTEESGFLKTIYGAVVSISIFTRDISVRDALDRILYERIPRVLVIKGKVKYLSVSSSSSVSSVRV